MFNLQDCHMPENCSSGQHTSTADVTVIVTDADDLSPEFTKSDYKVSIFDDAVEVSCDVRDEM